MDAAAAATMNDASLAVIGIPRPAYSLGFSALRRPVECKQRRAGQRSDCGGRRKELRRRHSAPQGSEGARKQIAEERGEEPQRDRRRGESRRREASEQTETDRQDVQ